VVGLLAFLDFLNSREKAILFWAIAIVIWAAVKSDGLGALVLGILRSLVNPKMLLLFGSAAAYCAILVFAGEQAGLWHTTALKETLYWFLASGVILVGEATQASPHDPGFFKMLLGKAVRFTLIVEFLVNLYVFPFGVELLLVPLIALLVGMQVVAGSRSTMAQAKKAIDGALIAIGSALMVYVVVAAISDLEGLLTRENGEDFLLAPALTLAFAPFLYVVAWYSRRELDNLHKGRRAAFSSRPRQTTKSAVSSPL
jgi:hypothetical protein